MEKGYWIASVKLKSHMRRRKDILNLQAPTGIFLQRKCISIWVRLLLKIVMHGPWLPVYSGGVSLILVALARWRRSPLKEAALIIFLCGTVEYMTSYYLEVTKGMRWWDYTVYFLTPFLDSLLSKLPTKLLVTASIVLVLAFVADVIYSHHVPNIGEGITDYDEYKGSSTLLLADEGARDQNAHGDDVMHLPQTSLPTLLAPVPSSLV